MLTYIDGNLFDHITPGVLIPNICNDAGKWECWPFESTLAMKYPLAKDTYKASKPWTLGDVSIVRVDERVLVANMIARPVALRHGSLGTLDLETLRGCMSKVADTCASGYRILCPEPRFGMWSGERDAVKQMILDVWRNVDVTVVRFKKGK